MSVERVLWEQDATGLAGLVQQGEVSPQELVDAAIARAEATRPDINAIAEPLYDTARLRAKTVDRKLPLAGVPFAIKDLGIAIKGVPTHGGSRIPAFTADFNSVMTERYLAAGLIPIATSTSPEHGLRLMTESAAFGITRNPWNTGHTTGGSSGGPWFINYDEATGLGTLNSLNSFKYSTLGLLGGNRMFGPYFGSVVQALYSSASQN